MIKMFPRQSKIRRILTSNTTPIRELLIGWGAWGAKSATWACRLCFMCNQYPGTRRFMWRSEIKKLKESTYRTFLDVAKERFWFTYWVDFRLTWENVVKFRNWSEIFLLDMKYYPNKDPDFDNFWSTEFTWGFIDEVNQVVYKWFMVASTRVWRYKNDFYGIPGILLMSCNPAKNRVYKEFYKKQKDGSIPLHRMFINVLARHNPYCPKDYIRKLLRMPNWPLKQKLAFWNREYDDTPGLLFARQDLVSMLSKRVPIEQEHEKYIICDVARHWVDKTTVSYREGMQWRPLFEEQKSDIDKLSKRLVWECERLWVKIHNLIIDEDWVGWWVVDNTWGRGFLNNWAVIPDPETWEKPNYQNLKTQCYFELASRVKAWDIWFDCDPTMQDIIAEELHVARELDLDKDQKRRIIGKKDRKVELWRSPDRADNIMMRMLPIIDTMPDLSRALSRDENDTDY